MGSSRTFRTSWADLGNLAKSIPPHHHHLNPFEGKWNKKLSKKAIIMWQINVNDNRKFLSDC